MRIQVVYCDFNRTSQAHLNPTFAANFVEYVGFRFAKILIRRVVLRGEQPYRLAIGIGSDVVNNVPPLRTRSVEKTLKLLNKSSNSSTVFAPAIGFCLCDAA